MSFFFSDQWECINEERKGLGSVYKTEDPDDVPVYGKKLGSCQLKVGHTGLGRAHADTEAWANRHFVVSMGKKKFFLGANDHRCGISMAFEDQRGDVHKLTKLSCGVVNGGIAITKRSIVYKSGEYNVCDCPPRDSCQPISFQDLCLPVAGSAHAVRRTKAEIAKESKAIKKYHEESQIYCIFSHLPALLAFDPSHRNFTFEFSGDRPTDDMCITALGARRPSTGVRYHLTMEAADTDLGRSLLVKPKFFTTSLNDEIYYLIAPGPRSAQESKEQDEYTANLPTRPPSVIRDASRPLMFVLPITKMNLLRVAIMFTSGLYFIGRGEAFFEFFDMYKGQFNIQIRRIRSSKADPIFVGAIYTSNGNAADSDWARHYAAIKGPFHAKQVLDAMPSNTTKDQTIRLIKRVELA